MATPFSEYTFIRRSTPAVTVDLSTVPPGRSAVLGASAVELTAERILRRMYLPEILTERYKDDYIEAAVRSGDGLPFRFSASGGTPDGWRGVDVPDADRGPGASPYAFPVLYATAALMLGYQSLGSDDTAVDTSRSLHFSFVKDGEVNPYDTGKPVMYERTEVTSRSDGSYDRVVTRTPEQRLSAVVKPVFTFLSSDAVLDLEERPRVTVSERRFTDDGFTERTYIDAYKYHWTDMSDPSGSSETAGGIELPVYGEAGRFSGMEIKPDGGFLTRNGASPVRAATALDFIDRTGEGLDDGNGGTVGPAGVDVLVSTVGDPSGMCWYGRPSDGPPEEDPDVPGEERRSPLMHYVTWAPSVVKDYWTDSGFPDRASFAGHRELERLADLHVNPAPVGVYHSFSAADLWPAEGAEPVGHPVETRGPRGPFVPVVPFGPSVVSANAAMDHMNTTVHRVDYLLVRGMSASWTSVSRSRRVPRTSNGHAPVVERTVTREVRLSGSYVAPAAGTTFVDGSPITPGTPFARTRPVVPPDGSTATVTYESDSGTDTASASAGVTFSAESCVPCFDSWYADLSGEYVSTTVESEDGRESEPVVERTDLGRRSGKESDVVPMIDGIVKEFVKDAWLYASVSVHASSDRELSEQSLTRSGGADTVVQASTGFAAHNERFVKVASYDRATGEFTITYDPSDADTGDDGDFAGNPFHATPVSGYKDEDGTYDRRTLGTGRIRQDVRDLFLVVEWDFDRDGPSAVPEGPATP